MTVRARRRAVLLAACLSASAAIGACGGRSLTQWRAQPAALATDPATWVGAYYRALAQLEVRFAPLFWAPPRALGPQTGRDTLLWAEALIAPLLRSSPARPAVFLGICGRVAPRLLREESTLYVAELEAPRIAPDPATLREPPLPPDAGPVELTFAIRVRSAAVTPQCGAAPGGAVHWRETYRAWRNAEGRWRVQTVTSGEVAPDSIGAG